MNYIDLSEYRNAWVFRHKDMPVSSEDLAQIKPLSESSAIQLWRQRISKESDHPAEWERGDWAANEDAWPHKALWQKTWDSASPDLPELILEQIDWADNVTVFFCYDSYKIIETNWAVFKRNWKNFLFFDDGPLLIARKKKQAIQFFQNGSFAIGAMP
ncbi:DUF2947 domain-containing protein [Alkalimarinus coralli]|uniref:DUF2947 domain-containing protein n=1 Tax=Alkalimarinus coralli TaxID=2935863 RepID=UPI0035140B7C